MSIKDRTNKLMRQSASFVHKNRNDLFAGTELVVEGRKIASKLAKQGPQQAGNKFGNSGMGLG